MTQTMLELGEYAAEPAVWVNTWRHQGHLQAMVQGRSLLVSTEDLFKVLQGYANALANSVVYARCFVKELNRRAQLCLMECTGVCDSGRGSRQASIVNTVCSRQVQRVWTMFYCGIKTE
ncbi:unnamed protein product [Durusdinium trenchii]|uniref:Uncharacterized protein n=1 Tax=Durusdinium trenchii TaxID=1381693 RepID=A0ABP0L0D1_9DINO